MREGSAAAGRTASSPGTHRFQLAWPKTVLVVLGCLVLALGAVFVPLARLSHQGLAGNGGGSPFWTFLPFGVVGFVVAWRRPRNRLGWILADLATAIALGRATGFWSVVGRVTLLVQPGPV
jgi:hypothetical protein